MKVVLMGYMGSGKTSVGKKLSKVLKIPFLDLDDYISKKEELTIPEVFKQKGEIYFRKKETQYLEELLTNDENFILSVGGGTPCYASNIEIITKNSFSIYLKSNISTIYNRLSNQKSKEKRPLIASIPLDKLEEFIAKHLFERAPFYEQATQTIIVDKKTVKEIGDEINLSIRQKNFL